MSKCIGSDKLIFLLDLLREPVKDKIKLCETFWCAESLKDSYL
jgi:hypothetical protein